MLLVANYPEIPETGFGIGDIDSFKSYFEEVVNDSKNVDFIANPQSFSDIELKPEHDRLVFAAHGGGLRSLSR